MENEFYEHRAASVEDLIPYAMNSRDHSDEQVAQLAASIREFGFTNPIIIDENNNLIAGHGRLMAARKLKMDRVPAVVVTGFDDRKRRALVIADNKLALNATWNMEALLTEVQDLGDEFGELMGFSEDELVEMLRDEDTEGLTDEDSVPDLPIEPVTVEGDVWLLGRHRLMCGDSTSIDAVEKLMNNEKADLLHTDPPYNVDYDNASRPKAGKTNFGKIKNDSMSGDNFYKFLLDSLSCGFAACKDGSTAYVWHASREHVNFTNALVNSGFDYTQQIIWKKPMLLGRGRYQSAHEPCLMGVKGSPFFTDDRTKTTVWDFGGYDKSKNMHPTQKPFFIPEEAINNSSKQGSNVLDLFGGSGSTMLACEKLGRNGFVMELDPKYCDVIVQRWQEYTGQEATHEESGKTYAELSK